MFDELNEIVTEQFLNKVGEFFKLCDLKITELPHLYFVELTNFTNVEYLFEFIILGTWKERAYGNSNCCVWRRNAKRHAYQIGSRGHSITTWTLFSSFLKTYYNLYESKFSKSLGKIRNQNTDCGRTLRALLTPKIEFHLGQIWFGGVS